MEIHYLDAVAPRISEITPKPWNQLQTVLIGQFIAHFRQLSLITNDDTKVPVAFAIGSLPSLEHGKELMLPKLEESVPFTLIELFQPEDIYVKGDRFLDVTDFDRHMIAAVNLDTH